MQTFQHTHAHMQTHTHTCIYARNKNVHKYTDSSHKNTHKYTNSANLSLTRGTMGYSPSSTSLHAQVENGDMKKTVLSVYYTSSRKCAHQRKNQHIETVRRVLRSRSARPESFACPLYGTTHSHMLHAHSCTYVFVYFKIPPLKQTKGGGGRKDGNHSTKRERINERRGRRSQT